MIAQGTIALNLLEDRQENGKEKRTPHTFKPNNEERIKIVSREEDLFSNKQSTGKALRH